MTREIRKCSKCRDYSFSLGRCVRGKINPPTIKGGLSAAQFMGLSYICPFAKHYEKIKKELAYEMEDKVNKLISEEKEA